MQNAIHATEARPYYNPSIGLSTAAQHSFGLSPCFSLQVSQYDNLLSNKKAPGSKRLADE
jgi:hypothetical protein